MPTFYDFSINALDGKPFDLHALENKAVLVVNVASKCGFTPQYTGLQKLHQDYADKGVVILGVPCNQFGAQEPGNADEIASFCSTTYEVSFPILEKVDVNGSNAHPLYQWLKNQKPGLLGTEGIKWNFTKFLINKQGEVVDRFAPQTTPDDLRKEIDKLI